MNLQVPLGVLPKCETERSEMIDIMSSLQQYVPHLESATNTGSTQQKHDEVVHQLMFRGDQLTAARARGTYVLGDYKVLNLWLKTGTQVLSFSLYVY